MANRGRKRKAGKRTKSVEARFLRPTDERTAHNDFQDAGAARRVTPVIDTLLRQQRITEGEYIALRRYRDQADICNRSETRDSCDFSIGGGDGHGPGASVVSAKLEVSRMDKLIGNLRPVVRAVAVDDMSLKDWAISQFGGREKTKRGKVVEIVPRGTNNGSANIDFGRWELKFAARRLMA